MFTPSIKALHAIVTGQRFAAVEARLGRSLSEEEKANLVGGEHAGGWETSFLLAQQPELVDPMYPQLARQSPPPVRPIARAGDALADWREKRGRSAGQTREIFQALARGVGWLLNAHYGYGGPVVTYQGTPSVASAELGHAFRHVMADECLQIVEDVTSGRLQGREVRSIASDPAIIQPHFWSRLGWATAIIVAAMVLL